MTKAMKISEDFEVEVVDFVPGLTFLQGCVQGYVEVVDFDINGVQVSMWLNEEGKGVFNQNDIATLMVRHRLFAGDYIAGPVVITGLPDGDGNTQGLTDYETAALKTWMGL